MGASMMKMWYNEVYKPYICDLDDESVLLLDDYVLHESEPLNALLQEYKNYPNYDTTELYFNCSTL